MLSNIMFRYVALSWTNKRKHVFCTCVVLRFSFGRFEHNLHLCIGTIFKRQITTYLYRVKERRMETDKQTKRHTQ